MIKTVFSAPDIECGGCASAIQKALSKAEGVGEIQVNIDDKLVTVQHDEILASVEALRTRLEHIGFPATVTPAAA